jgi:hypothetical protein
MEYLQGSSLQGWLSRGEPHTLWDILQFMAQLVNAVAHAQDRGVVIGCMCITPVHIMMLPNDAPVFIDASIPQPSPREHVKGTGMSWIRYLAPECVKEEQPNKQTDIWNMGVLMYEVLVGKPLFDGASERPTMSCGPLKHVWRRLLRIGFRVQRSFWTPWKKLNSPLSCASGTTTSNDSC